MHSRGSSLIEVLVGAAVFALISVAIYQTYSGMLNLINASKAKSVAAALANEQFEIARNLPYASVGIVGGIPSGVLPRFQTFARSNLVFQATTTIRNIDDPFDGQIGSTTNDLSPADYKQMAIEIGCSTCRNFVPVVFTGTIAPKNLETASTNGALFVKVFDANGAPVPGAQVSVSNPSTTPPVAIVEETDVNGLLQLVDVPPAAHTYRVVVTKSGYSSDRTYPPGAAGNPNPAKPDLTVALQQLTQTSFAIDRTGTITLSSVRDTCAPVGSAPFTVSGAKTIGGSPTVLKYTSSQSTNPSGTLSLSGLEWDSYTIDYTGTSYALAGTIPLSPVALSPNAVQNLALVLAPQNGTMALVTVRDSGTQLPVTGAVVRLVRGSYDATLTTGRGSITQTDWSGGGGQTLSSSTSRFWYADGNIEYAGAGGELSLKKVLGAYQTPGALESSTFDTGGAANFYQLLWSPGSQPSAVGSSSIAVQFATGNDPATSTWNFLGPDGTSGSYYTSENQNIASIHSGDRYFRYKLYLSTASSSITPAVSDVSVTFTSACVPPGQVLFGGISSTGAGTLYVSASGYQDYSGPVTVGSAYQTYDIGLSQ